MVPQILNLYEPSFNAWVGQLQVLFTNEGRRVDLKDMANLEKSQTGKDNARTANQDQMPASAPSVAPKGTKKVFSRPLDTPLKAQPNKTQLDNMLHSFGTEYDYQSSAPELSQANSEEARKRLRIARLKK